MTDWLVPALLALILVTLIVIAWRRNPGWRQLCGQIAGWQAQPAAQRQEDRLQSEREQREWRTELHDSARGTRQELSSALALFQQALLAQSGDVARTQNEQIDSFRTQLASMQQMLAQTLQQAAAQLAQHSQSARDAQEASLRRLA